MPIGKLFFFVPQTSSRVDSAGKAGDPYGPGSAYQDGSELIQYSAHTSMAGDQLPTCVGGECALTTILASKIFMIYSTTMVCLITLKVKYHLKLSLVTLLNTSWLMVLMY